MSSSTKTTNYQLSQFQNADVPAWLTDYNGDMQKIDAGIRAAKVQADGAASGVSALQTAVSGKQDTLTFDTTPISGSNNPVTSSGIYNALQNVSIQTDAVPTAGSTKAVQSGGVYSALQGKQNTLTFDDTPTQNSQNPVTSGGVFTAIQNAGGVILLPVYGGAGVQSSSYAFKIGRALIAFHDGSTSITKTTFSQIGTRAFYAYTTSEYIAGNPLNLSTFAENSSEWLTSSNRQTFAVAVIGDSGAIDGFVNVVARFDGTNTRFIYVINEDLYNLTWVNKSLIISRFTCWLSA